MCSISEHNKVVVKLKLVILDALSNTTKYRIYSSVVWDLMRVANPLEYKLSYLSKPYVCFFLTALR